MKKPLDFPERNIIGNDINFEESGLPEREEKVRMILHIH